jgi:thiol:disulfide interchange protein
MFASRSLPEHMIRGIAGFSLLALAVWLAPQFWGALLLIPLGLVFLRGCPLCWTVGFVETLWNMRRRRNRQPAVKVCATCTIDLRGADQYGSAACDD